MVCDKNEVRQELMEIREYVLYGGTDTWDFEDFFCKRRCVTDER